MKRAIVSWSGGKDAAWSLYRIRGEFEIAALVCTIDEARGIVPIHNVPQDRIEAQADSLEVPLWKITLPQPCSNAEYAVRLSQVWERAIGEGIDTIVFGDLFLSDIRAWREQLLSGTGMTPVFPLWCEPTGALAREMIRGGLEATVCAGVSAGFPFDERFLESLPEGVDPCGENGEFHTFVRNMPGFKQCVELSR